MSSDPSENDPTEIPGEPTDRLKETFTSPYPIDDESTEWHALVTALGKQFKDISDTKDDILKSRFIQDADGKQLEKLASIFELERRTGETDATLRTRIKAELRTQLASGTYDDILNTASALLETDVSTIDITERYDEGPRIVVSVEADDFAEISTPGDVWNELLSRVSAAGVTLDTIVKAENYEIRQAISTPQSENLGVIGDFHGFDEFSGDGSFAGGEDDEVRDLTDAGSFSIIFDVQPTTNTTPIEGFGDSAFSAGSLDGTPDTSNTRDETTSGTYEIVMRVSPVGTETVQRGFGEAAFGAGQLDGNSDGIVTTETTIADPFTLQPTYSPPANTTITDDGYGTDVLDGAGAFTAGVDTDVTGTTTLTNTLTLTYAQATTQTINTGFGSSLLNGDGAFAAGADTIVTDTTDIATTINLLAADTSSTTVASDDDGSFDGSSSFDGSGTFS